MKICKLRAECQSQVGQSKSQVLRVSKEDHSQFDLLRRHQLEPGLHSSVAAEHLGLKIYKSLPHREARGLKRALPALDFHIQMARLALGPCVSSAHEVDRPLS